MAVYLNEAKIIGVVEFTDGTARYIAPGSSIESDKKVKRQSKAISVTNSVKESSEAMEMAEEAAEPEIKQPVPKKGRRKKKTRTSEQPEADKLGE